MWIGEQKEDMEYNNRGETTKHKAYEWDTTSNKWAGREAHYTTLIYSDKTDYCTQRVDNEALWDYTNNDWVNYLQDASTYNDNGTLSVDEMSLWNDSTSQWEISEIFTYYYLCMPDAIQNAENKGITIQTTDGKITASNNNAPIHIFDINGRAYSNSSVLPKGLYIVKVGGLTQKITVQ